MIIKLQKRRRKTKPSKEIKTTRSYLLWPFTLHIIIMKSRVCGWEWERKRTAASKASDQKSLHQTGSKAASMKQLWIPIWPHRDLFVLCCFPLNCANYFARLSTEINKKAKECGAKKLLWLGLWTNLSFIESCRIQSLTSI